jgi:hypothetical protein
MDDKKVVGRVKGKATKEGDGRCRIWNIVTNN